MTVFDHPSHAVLVSFRGDVRVDDLGESLLAVRPQERQFLFRRLSPYLKSAIFSLGAGAKMDELAGHILSAEGPIALATLSFYVRQFDEQGLLDRTVLADSLPYVTRTHIRGPVQEKKGAVDTAGRYTTSRFALMRRDGDRFLLESPRSHTQFIIRHGHMLSWWWQLHGGLGFAQALRANEVLEKQGAEILLRWLIEERFLTPLQAEETEEDADAALVQWEFHDLLFHARSRKGRHSNRYGGSYPWLGWAKSLPSTKASKGGTQVLLTVPGGSDGAAVFEALDKRRSLREYGGRPMALWQLSHFLYRSARVLESTEGDDETTRRPYPSGGGRYPLELFIAAFRCDGIERGLYHYDPKAHLLERIGVPGRLLDELADDLRTFTSRTAGWLPQISIVMTARFQRVSWKYQSVAYSLVLKEVGALMQTMYVVATAMGLAPCAVGGGDSDLFTGLTGENYYCESAVGEFLLGSREQELL